MKNNLENLLLEAERAFDEKFTLSLQGAVVSKHLGTGEYHVWAGQEIKEFYHQQILSILSEAEKATEAENKEVKDAEVMCKDCSNINEELADIHNHGHNSALSQVKSLWREFRGNLK